MNPGVCALRFLDQRLIRQYKSEQTVGDILDRTGSFDRGPFYVAGTPAVVADAIEAWLDRAGIDGINLRQFLTPGTAEDFIELVVFPNCAAAAGCVSPRRRNPARSSLRCRSCPAPRRPPRHPLQIRHAFSGNNGGLFITLNAYATRHQSIWIRQSVACAHRTKPG